MLLVPKMGQEYALHYGKLLDHAVALDIIREAIGDASALVGRFRLERGGAFRAPMNAPMGASAKSDGSQWLRELYAQFASWRYALTDLSEHEIDAAIDEAVRQVRAPQGRVE